MQRYMPRLHTDACSSSPAPKTTIPEVKRNSQESTRIRSRKMRAKLSRDKALNDLKFSTAILRDRQCARMETPEQRVS
jgi:hypothetical protein